MVSPALMLMQSNLGNFVKLLNKVIMSVRHERFDCFPKLTRLREEKCPIVKKTIYNVRKVPSTMPIVLYFNSRM